MLEAMVQAADSGKLWQAGRYYLTNDQITGRLQAWQRSKSRS